ncbi:MAG: hypothetical protein M1823_001405 [Watsoniomyces obsoletus]|nr:MAG: hypothetical protein M1823_001405 [Watsoniomyces obsoletus]
MSLPNRYHLRQVAPASSKGCMICYKPTSSVLITVDNRDFFYICKGHLSDKSFCSPIIDSEAIERAAKEAKEREIELVKKEYEEKQRLKKEKEKEKNKKKDKDKDKAGDKKNGKDDDDEDDDAKKKKKDDDVKNEELGINKDEILKIGQEEPRIFALHKSFYQLRLERLRNAELTKRNRERLLNPTVFPDVPKDGL